MSSDAPRPARPTEVTVAFWLLLAATVLLLGLAGSVVAYAVHFDGEISRAAALVPQAPPVLVSAERRGSVFLTLVVGMPALLLAAWLAATAVPVRRGSSLGRILVFVAAGGNLLFCVLQSCSGFLLLPLVMALGGDQVPDDGAPSDEAPHEESAFYQALYGDSDPLSVLFPVGLGTLLVLVFVVTVALLLTLPPARRYFHPQGISSGLGGSPSSG